MPNKNSEQYWIGKGIDLEGLWHAYDEGNDYVAKYSGMKVHLFRITLKNQAHELPLFNFEAVFKTIKGYFHDLKEQCLTRKEYNEAGPLFIYAVNRGSGIWDFLGELRQLIMCGSTLSDEKLMGERLQNMDRKIELLKKLFGNAVHPEDFRQFMSASTPRQPEHALRKLYEQGIQKVEISTDAFDGDITKAVATLIDVKELQNRIDQSPDRPANS